MKEDLGASPNGDRAGGLRPEPQASQPKALIPSAHDARIARYLCAYEAANGRTLAEKITYEGGWYRFRNTWRQIRSVRAAKMDEMIARLEWRASEDGRQFFRLPANP